MSPVPDDDVGFAELSNSGSDLDTHCPVTKSPVADRKTVSCRKRRHGVTDSVHKENLSSADHTSVHHATSPSCLDGRETPTSSKQSVKRAKECTDTSSSRDVRSSGQSWSARRSLVRCHSEAVIHQALSTSEQHSNLIGDFSQPHSLPLLSSAKHQDLRSISADTVSCDTALISTSLSYFMLTCIVREKLAVTALFVGVKFCSKMQRSEKIYVSDLFILPWAQIDVI